MAIPQARFLKSCRVQKQLRKPTRDLTDDDALTEAVCTARLKGAFGIKAYSEPACFSAVQACYRRNVKCNREGNERLPKKRTMVSLKSETLHSAGSFICGHNLSFCLL